MANININMVIFTMTFYMFTMTLNILQLKLITDIQKPLHRKSRTSSMYVCMVNIKLKYIFVETPRKFIIAKLSIRKLGSS